MYMRHCQRQPGKVEKFARYSRPIYQSAIIGEIFPSYTPGDCVKDLALHHIYVVRERYLNISSNSYKRGGQSDVIQSIRHQVLRDYSHGSVKGFAGFPLRRSHFNNTLKPFRLPYSKVVTARVMNCCLTSCLVYNKSVRKAGYHISWMPETSCHTEKEHWSREQKTPCHLLTYSCGASIEDMHWYLKMFSQSA
jgi:hypothetical protein